MASQAEAQSMRRAIAAARSHPFRTLPNPRVGCVILDPAGTVLSVGLHRGAGTPHAEVDALAHAGERARGCTVVVTLEPCNHTGRTGPCAQALLGAGVARVVFAQTDPTRAASGGAATLRAAGVDVEAGLLADEARVLNEHWTFAVERGRPFVTWKYAATLDGRSAAADGGSQWITGPEARHDVHARRAEADAIVVGTGTVIGDDPRLTLRDDDGVPLPYDRQPLRVVVGERPIPADARVLDDAAPTLQVSERDPDAVLATLAAREVSHVWLEGGPVVAGAFLRARLVDEVVGYVAPTLLGAGAPALHEPTVTTLAQAYQLDLLDLSRLGADIRLVARPRQGAR